MSAHLPIPEEPAKLTDWRKSRRLARDGFKDLAYLPTDGTVWNATLAAIAFAYRRQLSHDRIELLGERADGAKPWGRAPFRRHEGKWIPKSRPPVRFDAEHGYGTLDEWLELSLRRLLTLWPSAAAVEIFAALYQTLDPWQALEHSAIFAALDRLCLPPRRKQGGLRLFALKDDN